MAQHKITAIERSAFYRIGKKSDLASLLGVTVQDLARLASDKYYREWTLEKPGKKARLIEEPVDELGKLQARIHDLLRRVGTPDWLKSGKKGIRPQDNALAHCLNPYLTNVDIEAFYQTTKREYVFRCLVDEFKIVPDVASLLADLVSYKGHLPTGSPTSQITAFWAYKRTFEKIHCLCWSQGISMTLWVDDISFSSTEPLPRDWARHINKILSRVELRLKAKKTKRYSKGEFKIVTGSAISVSGDIRVRNAKRKEILDIIARRRVENLSLQEARSLFGKLAAQRQNEAEFFDQVYHRCKARIRHLESSH